MKSSVLQKIRNYNSSCRNGISVKQISAFVRTISVTHVYDISDTTLFIVNRLFTLIYVYILLPTLSIKRRLMNGVKTVQSG